MSMKFRIEKVKSRKHNYILFYSAPTKAETNNAFQRLMPLCHKLAEEQLSGFSYLKEQVDKELEMIKKTESAVAVEVAKATADLSYKLGYPVTLFGEESGLLMMSLLGVSNVQPRQYEYSPLPSEICVGDALKNGFTVTLAIAEPIKDELVRYLNYRFASVENLNGEEKCISLPSFAALERIGGFVNVTDNRNGLLHREAPISLYEVSWEISKKEFGGEVELRNPRSALDVARLYAYARCTANTKKSTSMFLDIQNYLFREDFYRDMTDKGITKEEALILSKQGIRKKNKEEVIERLSKFPVPKNLLFAFGELQNIWSIAPCLSRLNALFQLNYYENYPDYF